MRPVADSGTALALLERRFARRLMAAHYVILFIVSATRRRIAARAIFGCRDVGIKDGLGRSHWRRLCIGAFWAMRYGACQAAPIALDGEVRIERLTLNGKQAPSDIPDMVDTQSFISWVAALQSAIQEQANNK